MTLKLHNQVMYDTKQIDQITELRIIRNLQVF